MYTPRRYIYVPIEVRVLCIYIDDFVRIAHIL